MGKENVQTENAPSNVPVGVDPPSKKATPKEKKASKAGSKGDKGKEKKSKADKTPPEKEDDAATVEGPSLDELVGGVKISEKLQTALTDLREPKPTDKTRIQEDTKELAWKLKSLCDGYKFEQRGTLFASDIENGSCCNIEVHLVRTGKGTLPSEDCQALYDAARSEFEHLSGVCVGWSSADGKPLEAWGPQHLKKQELTSMTVTGTRKVPGGWLVPMQLEVSVAHSKRHDAVKITDVADNLDKGDYAGVLLQLRELLKNKKRLREQLSATYNSHLGRLRFLVTQFQMADELGNKFKDKKMDYFHNGIGGLNLEWYTGDPSTKVANKCLQDKAAAVLKHLHDDYLPAIKPASQRDVFQAAYARTLGR